MHRRLGSATLSQLAFPGENNPNFPWEKSHWDNTVVKSKSRGEAGQYCAAQVFRDCSVFEGEERESCRVPDVLGEVVPDVNVFSLFLKEERVQ